MTPQVRPTDPCPESGSDGRNRHASPGTCPRIDDARRR